MGRLAQLVRAPALQAGCRGFESLTAHQFLIHYSRAPVALSHAASAQDASVSYHFTEIKDFFRTAGACCARTGLANNGAGVEVKPHWGDSEELVVGEMLVGGEICMPAARCTLCEGSSAVAQIGQGVDAHSASLMSVDEGGGDLAVVGQAHGAVTDGAASGHAYAVGKAAIHFNHGQYALVLLREQGGKETRRTHAQPHAQYLPRAQMPVQGCRLPEQRFEFAVGSFDGHGVISMRVLLMLISFPLDRVLYAAQRHCEFGCVNQDRLNED